MPGQSETLLRPAGPGDAAALAALRIDRALQHLLMANPDDALPDDPVAEAQGWITRRESVGWFRVIDDGTGAQGFVQISEIHKKNRFGWLGLALLPEARGRGLGAQALAAAEVAARVDLGLRKLLLQVQADNLTALTLYGRAGWRRAGLLAAHYYDGAALNDVVICEKALA